jgi:hypothetical protein
MNPFDHAQTLSLESFGVKISIRCNDPAGLSRIKAELPHLLAGGFVLDRDDENAKRTFDYIWNSNGLDELYRQGELVIGPADRMVVLDQLNIHTRLTVAEFAVGHLFVHAGVVGWQGKAIMLPARSFSGKSTLVLELVRQGCLYYSDEYAILDTEGRVSPFPKMISLRSPAGGREQTDHSIENFGGSVGVEKIPVGLVVLTTHVPGATWEPVELSGGRAVISLLRDTIPVRNDPRFAFQVLSRVTEMAKIVESPRGEASAVAAEIIEYMAASPAKH